MVTEHDLTKNKQYSFKNLTIEVLSKDDSENVLVFKAAFVRTSHDGKISPGLMDFNDLTRQPDCPSVARGAKSKRPPGYFLLDTIEHSGVSHAFFVSEEWLDNTPNDTRKELLGRWTANILQPA